MRKDYYKILELNKNATQDEIKKSYRNLCKKYHPDHNGGDDTKFKEINEAYSILGDEDKKREYDHPAGMFGGGGFHFNNFRQMASDINVMFTITIEEAHNGCKKTVNINNKTLAIDIPKGSTNGKLLKISGLGTRGYNIYGQEAVGDLIVKVNVISTEKMWLNDNGLLEVVHGVDWIDAILGTEMTINLFGKDVKFRVPKYTQNGGFTIVGGAGFHKFKSDECGNLKVNFIVRMPKNLTSEQIEHLKKIKESL